jgi:MFS family permease
VSWRLVFLVSVPFGIFGTVWSYRKLKELGVRKRAKLDLGGNLTFAAGLIAVLVGITYGIQPYGGHVMGWTSPLVLTLIGGGIAALAVFCFIETRSPSRCSGSASSRSGRSPRATSPRCSPASAAAG